MSKYLYGAKVQGIQEFIFETNKLREIVGASEFVEDICTARFDKFVSDHQDAKKLIGAAGNIRCMMSEETCREVMHKFAKDILKDAPGLTISQAAVRLAGEHPTAEDFDALEKRLEVQRNLPLPTLLPTWMPVERSRRTGIGADHSKAYKDRNGETIYPSAQEVLKRAYAETTRLLHSITGDERVNWKSFPLEIDDITGKNHESSDSWLAVMHADGNGLGQLIQQMMTDDALAGEKLHVVYKGFSEALDIATKAAAKQALDTVFSDLAKYSEQDKVPIRPILLGGDDITIIIRAENALAFTTEFMTAFEKHTKEQFQAIDWEPLHRGLTIKAGIAYVKPSYPFHFAVNLAEELSKHAKSEAKKVQNEGAPVPSCLMFHQVYSSFTGKYSSMVARELTIGRKDDVKHFDYGPYFLHEQDKKSGYASLADLQRWISEFQKDDAPKSQLRALITEYADGNEDKAQQYYERIKSLKDYAEYLKSTGMENSIFTAKRPNGKQDKLPYSPALDIIKMADLHPKPEAPKPTIA